jgi:restriction system protein
MLVLESHLHMKRFPSVEALTPTQFEAQVRRWLESVANPLEAFSANHSESLVGVDGEYTIDVTARFRALGGASFLVLVECKKHKNPVKREVVQALRAKQEALGAQKAIVVATAKFQSGAIEYASKHGIALAQIVSGSVVYVQANFGREVRAIPADAEDYAGLFYGPNPDGRLAYPEGLSVRANAGLASYLGVEQ